MNKLLGTLQRLLKLGSGEISREHIEDWSIHEPQGWSIHEFAELRGPTDAFLKASDN